MKIKAIIDLPEHCCHCKFFDINDKTKLIEERCLLFGYKFSQDRIIAIVPCPACVRAKQQYKKLKGE